MARDWFTHGFGAAIADVRAKLIEEAWFGRAQRPAESSGWDRVLELKSDPDHAAERAQHAWLEKYHADRPREAAQHDTDHDHGIDR